MDPAQRHDELHRSELFRNFMQLVCSNTGTTRVRSTAEAEEKMRRAGGYVRGGHHKLITQDTASITMSSIAS